MTPLLPKPEHYLHNLITMTSPEAKKLWRRAIKEHFNCTCVYCGESYEFNQLTLDHVKPRCKGGESVTKNLVPACLGHATKAKVVVIGLDGREGSIWKST
ncbi:MAG: hypothetical protein CM15mV40_300 [Caudoviricetes sp.]|nr:MAG: hypothetical protein CM15mV40_300 [Caudoviricetes sp.]